MNNAKIVEERLSEIEVRMDKVWEWIHNCVEILDTLIRETNKQGLKISSQDYVNDIICEILLKQSVADSEIKDMFIEFGNRISQIKNIELTPLDVDTELMMFG